VEERARLVECVAAPDGFGAVQEGLARPFLRIHVAHGAMLDLRDDKRCERKMVLTVEWFLESPVPVSTTSRISDHRYVGSQVGRH